MNCYENRRQGKSVRVFMTGIGVLCVAGALLYRAPSLHAGVDEYDGDVLSGELLRWPVKHSKKEDLTAPVDGLVSAINVKEMQRVSEGDVVAQIDDELQQSQVAVAEARVKEAAALRDEQLTRFEETKRLRKTRAVNEFEVRVAKLQYEGAEIAVQVAEETLNLERVRLARYQIKAPFTGEILRVEAEKGGRLNQGDVAIKLVSRDPLEAHMHLPIVLMDLLKVGNSYFFDAEEPVNQRLSGKLKTLDADISSAAGTFRCVFTIDNPDLKLPAGFKVRLIWPQPTGATAAAGD